MRSQRLRRRNVGQKSYKENVERMSPLWVDGPLLTWFIPATDLVSSDLQFYLTPAFLRLAFLCWLSLQYGGSTKQLMFRHITGDRGDIMAISVTAQARQLDKTLHNLRARNVSEAERVEAIEVALRQHADFQKKAMVDLLNEIRTMVTSRDPMSERDKKVFSLVSKAQTLLTDV